MRTSTSLAAIATLLALLACKKESEKEAPKAAASAGAATPAASGAAAVPVGGKAACIYRDGAWCAEFTESDAEDKKMCEEAQGRWSLECPTQNMIATCKGVSSTKYYKPGYTLEDAKTMCSAPGDKFTPVP